MTLGEVAFRWQLIMASYGPIHGAYLFGRGGRGRLAALCLPLARALRRPTPVQ